MENIRYIVFEHPKIKHAKEIDYPGGIKKLADDLSNLTYDTLEEFLKNLSEKIKKDGQADKKRGRNKLAKQLNYAAKYIGNAWKICEPFMT